MCDRLMSRKSKPNTKSSALAESPNALTRFLFSLGKGGRNEYLGGPPGENATPQVDIVRVRLRPLFQARMSARSPSNARGITRHE